MKSMIHAAAMRRGDAKIIGMGIDIDTIEKLREFYSVPDLLIKKVP